MSDLTRDDAGAFSPAALASALRTLALIPNSYSPASVTVLLQEAAGRIDPGPSDSSPSDIAYDDMTRAWRNGDYPLAWSLADALLQYLANGGQPLTGGRSLFYVRQIRAYYSPLPNLGTPCAVCGESLERVDVNAPDEWAHAGDEPADRHAPVLASPTPVADALQVVDAAQDQPMPRFGSTRPGELDALRDLAGAVRSHGIDTITRSQLIHALTEQDVIATTPRAAGYTAEQFADLLMITGRECRQHHGPASR